MGGAHHVEAGLHPVGGGLGHGQQQPALGSEALDRRRRRQPDLPADVDERQPAGAEPADHGGGRGDDVGRVGVPFRSAIQAARVRGRVPGISTSAET
jgi:hypothetical protein